MHSHHLKLNLSKLGLLFFPHSSSPSADLPISIPLESTTLSPSSSAKSLKVTLDPALSYTQHITTLTRTCRFFLSNIRWIHPFLTDYSTQLLVQSLVLSRLDYCNTLLAGMPASTTRPLQLIQNSAARLVFSLPRFAHATPLLRSLHLIPIPARIQFKTLTLTYRCLDHTAPSYLQVSHLSMCACLSDRNKFPTFFRTIPSDYHQSRALAQLVKHFGWTWVGAIRSDNDYGNSGMETFIKTAQQEGICIENSEAIYRTYSHRKFVEIVNIIKKSSSKVIVVFAFYVDIEFLVRWAVYLGSKERFKILGGAIGFVVKNAEIPGLKEFLLVKRLRESVFKCTLTAQENDANNNPCTGQENELNNKYSDVSDLSVPINVYKAVYAVAHSLHALIKCNDDQGTFHDKKKKIEPLQVLHYLKKVNFTNRNGERVFFDENGDPVAQYALINWQLNKEGINTFEMVGLYDASLPERQQIVMNVSTVWSNNQHKVPKSVCSETCLPGTRKAIVNGKPIYCFDCIPCAEGEFSNRTDSSDCSKCPVEYSSNQQRNQCILKKVEFLTYGEIMGILLVILSLTGACLSIIIVLIFYKYRDTPIV
ncbi:CASR protein, partial [Amia calva]|nr:CASR protein [Amia calva]